VTFNTYIHTYTSGAVEPLNCSASRKCENPKVILCGCPASPTTLIDINHGGKEGQQTHEIRNKVASIAKHNFPQDLSCVCISTLQFKSDNNERGSSSKT
jgi:hypothetical protein